jgi:hypothetical protein
VQELLRALPREPCLKILVVVLQMALTLPSLRQVELLEQELWKR